MKNRNNKENKHTILQQTRLETTTTTKIKRILSSAAIYWFLIKTYIFFFYCISLVSIRLLL